MKTLRIARNVAALFILLMGLLAAQPGVGRVQANSRGCGLKFGANGCFFTANGTCQETKCVKGGPCADWGCVQGIF